MKVFFTIAGTCHYYGSDFMEPGMKVSLIKEPDNEVDSEAIRVEMEGLGKIGYVAATPYTRLGESMSAGKLGSEFEEAANGTIKYVLEKGVLCELDKEAEKTDAEDTRN